MGFVCSAFINPPSSGFFNFAESFLIADKACRFVLIGKNDELATQGCDVCKYDGYDNYAQLINSIRLLIML